MEKGWKIGTLFGIPLFLDYSWFVILVWVTYINSQYYQKWGLLQSWGAGLAIAMLLFASVLLHELGHSLVAMSQGIKVNSITLFLFGGVASIEKESETPSQAFQVAIAGPLVSLTLFFLFGLTTLAIPESTLINELIHRLAEINLVLAIFNMIPGLPLDGGQVLKAAIWKITGNRFTGVRWAANTGRFIGWCAIAFGITVVLLTSDYTGFWLALIGWFALRNASSYNRITDLQEALLKIQAADAMTRNFRVVDANLTLQQFVDKYLENSYSSGVFSSAGETLEAPVSNKTCSIYFAAGDGRYRGLVSIDALRFIERSFWQSHSLNLILQPFNEIIATRETASLVEIINCMESHNLTWITVLSPAGAVAGTIHKGDIVRSLAEYLKVAISDAEIKRIEREGRYPPGLPLEAIARSAK